MRACPHAVATCLACAALAGCSPLGAPQAPATTSMARAQASHEYPAPAPAPQRAAAGYASGAQAVRAFAVTYINWDAGTVAARLRRLAAQSIGQARAAMQLAAAQAAGDYELKRGGIANHGVVEAVAPLAGAASRFVVVTREATTATLTTAYQGLRPAWHVTVATASRVAGDQWVVSGWQPES